MKQRVFSIETEYAISYINGKDSEKFSKEDIYNWLINSLIETYNIPKTNSKAYFLQNGSKIYYDCGHLECALPECRSFEELIIYDKAMDLCLEEAIEKTNKTIKKKGYAGEICITKNNIDTFGNTFGTHENYLIQRSTSNLNENDFFKMLVQQLVPFLITRQIICGSGKFGQNYQISQRSDYIDKIIGLQTTNERPIINLKDEPLSDKKKFRRLHLILGDANMSEWSLLLKVGTTAIVLEMIEENFIYKDISFDNPLKAIKDISYDITFKKKYLLKNGSRLSAIEIQKEYLELAKKYYQYVTPDNEINKILETWEETIERLEVKPYDLRGKIDWLIKYFHVGSIIKSQKFIPDDPRIKELDIKYHNIQQDRGIFNLLKKNNYIDSYEEYTDSDYSKKIIAAKTEPPQFTRARIRGDIIKKISRGEIDAVVDWDYVEFKKSGKKIVMNDPLDFLCTELFDIENNNYIDVLLKALENNNDSIKLNAMDSLNKLSGTDIINNQIMVIISRLLENKNVKIRLKAEELIQKFN